MAVSAPLSARLLHIDAAAETGRIVAAIRGIVLRKLNRKGAVVGLSGGIDSAVVAFLCARALGHDRVLALFTPEAESSSEAMRLGRIVAQALGVETAVENIGPILTAAHCYERRDEAVRKAVPEYREGYQCRIVLPGASSRHSALFSAVVQSPDGEAQWVPLSIEDYLDIAAAAGLKERARSMVEYYYADRLEYAVAGAQNRLEYEQGLFVKNGDGTADLKPIAHLYNSQVYQLADYLGVPDEIRRRPPDAAAYLFEQAEEEPYLMLPLDKMDLCLYGKNSGIPASDLSSAVGLDPGQVQRVYDAIQAKRAAAKYLRSAPLLVHEVSELSGPGIPGLLE